MKLTKAEIELIKSMRKIQKLREKISSQMSAMSKVKIFVPSGKSNPPDVQPETGDTERGLKK